MKLVGADYSLPDETIKLNLRDHKVSGLNFGIPEIDQRNILSEYEYDNINVNMASFLPNPSSPLILLTQPLHTPSQSFLLSILLLSHKFTTKPHPPSKSTSGPHSSYLPSPSDDILQKSP